MPFYPELKPVKGEVFEGDFETIHEYLRALHEELDAMRQEGHTPGKIRVQIPVGAITTGSSATVTVYGADHTLGPETLTAFNRSGVTLGDAAVAMTGYVEWIVREGEWQITNQAQECA